MGTQGLWQALAAAQEAGERVAVVTVVEAEGSTPQKPGAKMLVFGDGRIVGTIGGGCVEAELVRRGRRALETGRADLASFELTPDQAGEDGLVCGGRMRVFVEPVESAPVLCVLGAGHIAVPLAQMAKRAGFQVEVVDDRVQFANEERFPAADRIIVADFQEAAAQLTLGSNSYGVVVTRGHRGDVGALAALVGKGLKYVGLLGSKVKAVHVLSLLRERGVPAEDLARVHTPVGLDIGAQTPEEIAVSILAELIAVRRGLDPTQCRSLKMDLPAAIRER
jgi:xanthine dehydrogenase accessory factor